MPAQSRTADQRPKRTPSFVCEVPLRVRPQEEHTLLTRLEAARQVYNACLGEARQRVRLVRESKAFRAARTLSRDDPERTRLFRAARAQHGFSDDALQAYAQPFGHSWLGEHLDSHVLQKLASRAYGAANRLLLGRAKRVRFKGQHQLDSVEGKTNTTGLRWCTDHLEWSGLVLPARLDPRDLVVVHGLSCPVKYVRLVRRKLGLRYRFSAQLVCEGRPSRKAQHTLGQGSVGLDLGPSTIAVVAEQQALLQPFCPEVTPNWQRMRRLERQLDRQRRANNPANYDQRGRVKKGQKRWKVSKRQRKVQAQRREVYRRLSATRKRSHGQLAHRVLTLGSTFQLEQISYRAWQKQFGRSVGRSAPGMFVSLLSRLAATCWRAGLRAEHPAGQTLATLPLRGGEEEAIAPALARVCLWGLRTAGPLQCVPGPFCHPRNVRAEGTPGLFGLATWRTPRAGSRSARHPEPTRKWTACAVLLWSASG